MSEPPPRQHGGHLILGAQERAWQGSYRASRAMRSSDISVMGLISPTIPALLNAMSRPPKRSTAVSIRALATCSCLMSPGTAIACRPPASMSLTSASSSAERRPLTTTRPFSREQHGRRVNAGAGPGDDGHFLRQYIHLQLPSCCVRENLSAVPRRYPLRSQPACGYAC